MEQRHLRQFIAVAEQHCFSEAAQQLGVTQPALSRQIQRLEEELGVQLFHRTPRRVELTEAGQVFLDRVRGGLVQLERAVAAARRVGRGEMGHLALGFVSAATYSVLPPILRSFHERYPEVQLDVEELSSDQQVSALDDGRIQFGFLYPPEVTTELEVKPVLREAVVAVLRRGHPLARAPRVHLADLAGEPMLLFRRDLEPALFDTYMRLIAAEGVTPNLMLGPNSLHLTVSLVAAGLGFALAPASVRNLRRSDVVYRAIHPRSPKITLAAAWREDDSSPAREAFLEVVRQVANQTMLVPSAAPANGSGSMKLEDASGMHQACHPAWMVKTTTP